MISLHGNKVNSIMKSQLLVALPLVFLAASASASDANTGPYLGAGIGVAQSADTDNYQDLDADGVGYNVYGGYYFNRIVGVEGNYNDYADMKANGQKSMAPTSASVSANLGYTFDNTIRPFALVGLSYVDLNANDNALMTDDSGVGFHFGVGVEYSPLPNLTLRAISQADAVNVENTYSYGSTTINVDDSTLAFNSVSLGASYRFK